MTHARLSGANETGGADAPMTTAEAARYCGFKSTAAIRKALRDGRLSHSAAAAAAALICGRGRRSMRSWPAGPVVSSLPDVQVRLRPASEDIMEGTKWIKRWKYWIAPKPSRPGVWRLKGGGYLVRGRATTSDGKEARNPESGEGHGRGRRVQAPAGDARRGPQGAAKTAGRRMRFSEYAASLFERKVLKGEVESAKTREKWEQTLRLHLCPSLATISSEAIPRGTLRGGWRRGKKVQGRQVLAGDREQLARRFPGHLNEAVDESGWRRTQSPRRGTRHQHSLHLHRGGAQLARARRGRTFPRGDPRLFPQHFGMVALGFATGLRPSMLRPLRRKGPAADVLWENKVVLIRRSQTRGDEVREATKKTTRFRVTLPADLMAILRWHTERLPAGPMRRASSCFRLRPGASGPTALDKPFREVGKAIPLGKG